MTSNTIRTAEDVAAEILAWDCEDIHRLRDMLDELSSLRDENGQLIDVEAYVDMADLPSAEVPADIDTAYPVWAVDRQGRALVGDDARDIETLDDIRA